jgi:hypothetical protein
MGLKKSDLIDPNNWEEVADFAKSSGVTAKELYDYTVKNKLTNKTTVETMAIGCLVYDTLKKKSKLSTRSRIINLRKKIIAIKPNWEKFSQQQLYENANHALNRTPGFVKWDKKVRKQLF